MSETPFYPDEAGEHLFERTRDLFLAQRLARHTSPLTMTVYTHPSDDEMHGPVRKFVCRSSRTPALGSKGHPAPAGADAHIARWTSRSEPW